MEIGHGIAFVADLLSYYVASSVFGVGVGEGREPPPTHTHIKG